MVGKDPVAEQPYDQAGDAAAPWAAASLRLAEADTYWLATVRPDGRPHVAPLLGVWVGGALVFAASPASRKARNLAADPHCVVTTRRDALDLVVEGEAVKIRDEAKLHRVAEVFASKYGWHVTVSDGAFHATEWAPTAGPPPYAVYAVKPAQAFGFPWDDTFPATRWRF